MQKFTYKIRDLFKFEGETRGGKAKKNIIILFFLNGFNFVFTLLLVPLTLNYLGPLQYGIWLTLSSMLTWLSYMDFGIGNGLRNKLSEALAEGDRKLGRIYVSTAYAVFSIGLLLLWLIFFLIFGFVNWSKILNSPDYLHSQINTLVLFVFIFFSLQFLLKLIYSVTNADQMPAVNGFFSVLVNSSTVLMVYILLKTTGRSILYLGIGSSIIPIIIFIAGSIILFGRYYKDISPTFKSIKFKYAKDLVGLGLQFFVIQFAGLILFATDNLIITQILGPKEVTVYNIAYKYFFYVPIIFSVILSPFWSAYTEAYIKKDFVWIKSSTKKILRIWFLLSALAVIMVVISGPVYRIWVGPDIKVPLSLSIVMGIFVIMANWNNIFIYFINGSGKIRIQFINSIFVMIINIPLSIYFAINLNFGITGVMLATCVCVASAAVWAPIQYKKIVGLKATGIWAK